MYGDFGGGGRRGPPGRSFAPVRVGDELEVTIEAVGEKGDGVAKVKGFVLFVPNVQEGQVVKIRVTKVLRKVGFAELIGAGEAAKAEEPVPAPEDSEDFGEEKASEEPEKAEKKSEDDVPEDTELEDLPSPDDEVPPEDEEK